jgi:hypothetical protein
MTLEALITMIFIFALCLGGFLFSLYLSSKEN